MFFSDIGLTIIVTTLLILLLIAVVITTISVANRRHVQQAVKIAQMHLSYEKEQRAVAEQVMVSIGRELHDGVGLRLTFMKAQLQQQGYKDQRMATALEPVNNMMIETIREVSMLARSLNSDLIEKNGLNQSIWREVQRLTELKKYNVEWETDQKEPELDKDQKIIVFRIFQETINNILKHSEADNIYISLDGGDFKLMVQDDGKGFDAAEMIRSGKGSGLYNIRQRAELAKLKWNIETSPTATEGKGTIFTLEQMI